MSLLLLIHRLVPKLLLIHTLAHISLVHIVSEELLLLLTVSIIDYGFDFCEDFILEFGVKLFMTRESRFEIWGRNARNGNDKNLMQQRPQKLFQ